MSYILELSNVDIKIVMIFIFGKTNKKMVNFIKLGYVKKFKGKFSNRKKYNNWIKNLKNGFNNRHSRKED